MNKLIDKLHGDFSFKDRLELINYINLNEKEKQEILNWRNDNNIRLKMINKNIISWQSHCDFIDNLKKM